MVSNNCTDVNTERKFVMFERPRPNMASFLRTSSCYLVILSWWMWDGWEGWG